MFYYQHHIGDYRRDTGHLTLLEHGIYRQLLDRYYITENPLDANAMRLVCVRTTDECEAYARVLADFFVERDGLYFHKRCEHEIDKFRGKASKARNSAKVRWNKNNDLDIDANAMRTHSEGNANQLTNEPINQLTKNKTKEPFIVPDWIPQPAWQGFLESRKASKGAFTDRAKMLIVKQLQTMQAEGQDVAAVLDQSVANGWKGVFPLKTQQGAKNGKFNIHAYTRNELSKALEQGMVREVVDSGSAQEVFSDLPPKVHQRIS